MLKSLNKLIILLLVYFISNIEVVEWTYKETDKTGLGTVKTNIGTYLLNMISTKVMAFSGTGDNVPSCGERNLGYEFSDRTGHCYKFHPHAETWTTANWVCAGEGARLAVINSNVEAKVLVDLFERYPRSMIYGTESTDYVALGYYWESAASSWRTVDGQTLEQAGYYATWWPGQPSDMTNHPYGYIYRQGVLRQGVNHIKNPFICEKAPQPLCW